MPTSPERRRSQVRAVRLHVKRMAKWMLQIHLPVGRLTRPLFGMFYQLHVALRTILGWSIRFLWFEPLFRSQCRSVGRRFCMEQLPYIIGHGEIEIADDVQLSGKPTFVFSSRHGEQPRVLIGARSFLGHACTLIVGKRISIGSNCLIASGVRIADFDGHPLCAAKRRLGEPSAIEDVRPICIGNDVWIGHGAVILKGVQVGDRAVIGAHAVVTSDVDADTVVAGNPARCVKILR